MWILSRSLNSLLELSLGCRNIVIILATNRFHHQGWMQDLLIHRGKMEGEGWGLQQQKSGGGGPPTLQVQSNLLLQIVHMCHFVYSFYSSFASTSRFVMGYCPCMMRKLCIVNSFPPTHVDLKKNACFSSGSRGGCKGSPGGHMPPPPHFP